MKLEPRNRRLILERLKLEEEDHPQYAFIVPDKMKKSRADNEIFRVLDYSNDCIVSVSIGALVLIEGNMVEESHVGDVSFLSCKENFVIGIVKE
jgi:co-chaperonin GroES (HSP10)